MRYQKLNTDFAYETAFFYGQKFHVFGWFLLAKKIGEWWELLRIWGIAWNETNLEGDGRSSNKRELFL